MRLESLAISFTMPVEVLKTIWENIAHVVTHTLVEGYAILYLVMFIVI